MKTELKLFTLDIDIRKFIHIVENETGVNLDVEFHSHKKMKELKAALKYHVSKIIVRNVFGKRTDTTIYLLRLFRDLNIPVIFELNQSIEFEKQILLIQSPPLFDYYFLREQNNVA